MLWLMLSCILCLAATTFSTPSTTPGPLDSWEYKISSRLGDMEFNVTTRENLTDAADHFLLGMKALTCFWYDFAEEEFQKAYALDSDMCLAYWGQSMCKRMFLWNSDNPAAANELLDTMDTSCNMNVITQREKDYIAAGRALFDQNTSDKFERAKNYGDMVKTIHVKYDDDWAGSQYVLTLLETAGTNETIHELAREYITTILAKDPDHPAAIHYALHAFDFPGEGIAERGMDAASKYDDIVTYASHGNHMPAHIYIRLGMWKEAIDTERLALAAGDDYAIKYKNASITYDKWNRYHSLEYLQYYLLQRARFSEANDLVERMRNVMKSGEVDGDVFFQQTWIRMMARQVLETRNWDVPSLLSISMVDPPYVKLTDDPFWSSYSEMAYLLARGMQDILLGSSIVTDTLTMAQDRQTELEAMIPDGPYVKKAIQFMGLELRAAYEAGINSNATGAMEIMEEAVSLQESMVLTAADPSLLFIPTWEFMADLIRQYELKDHYNKAIDLYKKALTMRPKRAASEYGLYKMYVLLDDETNADDQLKIVQGIWSNPDTTFEAYEEIKPEEEEDVSASSDIKIALWTVVLLVLMASL